MRVPKKECETVEHRLLVMKEKTKNLSLTKKRQKLSKQSLTSILKPAPALKFMILEMWKITNRRIFWYNKLMDKNWYNKLVDKKKHKKNVLYIRSLKKRAEKLRKKADNWEVNTNIHRIMKGIDFPLEFFTEKELSEKEKKRLLRLTKYKLTSFKRHFASVHDVLQKNPMIWSKKIKETEKELEKAFAFYKSVTPLLFRKKTKKSKRKTSARF